MLTVTLAAPLFVIALASQESVAPPRLVTLTADDGRVAYLLAVGGDSASRTLLFRDPAGNRLKVERSGTRNPGMTYDYIFVGNRGSEIRIFNTYLFQENGPVKPMIVTIAGTPHAGLPDGASEATRFSKELNAAFVKLPDSFKQLLLNFYLFGQEVKSIAGVPAEAGLLGVLLTPDWVTMPGMPSLHAVETIGNDPDETSRFLAEFAGGQ